jgi:anti-sigma-K factor RskA
MHPSADVLALLAIGEPVGTPEDRDHIAGCAACTSEVQKLSMAVEIGRQATPGDTLLAPHPDVWQRVLHDLHLGEPGPDGRSAVVAPQPEVAASQSDRRNSGTRGRVLSIALAAAVALVLGFGAGLGWDRIVSPVLSRPHVQLNALPRWPGSTGEATITEDERGQRVLVVRVTTPKPSTGRREVWLSDSLALDMTSMGYLNGDTGTFPISPGMDLKRSPLVDVSEQPAGDTSGVHSGNSVVRGRLPI